MKITIETSDDFNPQHLGHIQDALIQFLKVDDPQLSFTFDLVKEGKVLYATFTRSTTEINVLMIFESEPGKA